MSSVTWADQLISLFQPLGKIDTKDLELPTTLKKMARSSSFCVPVASGVSRGFLLQPIQGAPKNLVIFCHALAQPIYFPNWHLFQMLISQGSAVFAYEQDGHGPFGSSCFDFQLSSRTLPLLLDRLQQCSIPGPIILCGHSAGAIAPLLYATRPEASSYIKGVIVVSPTLVIEDWPSVTKRQVFHWHLLRSLGLGLSQKQFYGFWRAFRLENTKLAPNQMLRLHIGIPPYEQLKKFCEEYFVKKSILKEVKTPVLWIHGEKDKISPIRKVESVIDCVQGGLYCYVERGKDHFGALISHRVAKYVSEFVSRID